MRLKVYTRVYCGSTDDSSGIDSSGVGVLNADIRIKVCVAPNIQRSFLRHPSIKEARNRGCADVER